MLRIGYHAKFKQLAASVEGRLAHVTLTTPSFAAHTRFVSDISSSNHSSRDSHGLPAPRSGRSPIDRPFRRNDRDKPLGVAILGVERADKALLNEIVECPSPTKVLQHYRANKEEYDFVSLGTALATILKLNKGMKPWKRTAVDKSMLDELVHHSIESLGSELSALQQASGLSGDKKLSALEQARQPRDVTQFQEGHRLRSIVNTAFSLSKLNRLPPVFCDHLSTSLQPHVEKLNEADSIQLVTTLRWANVPAPTLLTKLGAALLPKVRSFKTHNITALLDGYSQLHVAAPSLFEECAQVLAGRRDGLDARDLATSVAAFIRGAQATKTLKKLHGAADMQQKHVKTAHAYLSDVSATMRSHLSAKRFDPKHPMHFTAQGVAMSAWAYSQQMTLNPVENISADNKYDAVMKAIQQEKVVLDDLPLYGGREQHREDFELQRVLHSAVSRFCQKTTLITAHPSHIATVTAAVAATIAGLRHRMVILLAWLQACEDVAADSHKLNTAQTQKIEELKLLLRTRLDAVVALHAAYDLELTLEKLATAAIRLLDPASSGKEWAELALVRKAMVHPEEKETSVDKLLEKEALANRKDRPRVSRAVDRAIATEVGDIELESDEKFVQAVARGEIKNVDDDAVATEIGVGEPTSKYDPIRQEKLSALAARFSLHDVTVMAKAFASIGFQHKALFDTIITRVVRAEKPHNDSFDALMRHGAQGVPEAESKEDSIRDMSPSDAAELVHAFVVAAPQSTAQQMVDAVASAFQREVELHRMGYTVDVEPELDSEESIPSSFDSDPTFADVAKQSNALKSRLPPKARPAHRDDDLILTTGQSAVEDAQQRVIGGSRAGALSGNRTRVTWSGRLLARITWPDLSKLVASLALCFPSAVDTQLAKRPRADFSALSDAFGATEDAVERCKRQLRLAQGVEATACVERYLPEDWDLPGGPLYDSAAHASRWRGAAAAATAVLPSVLDASKRITNSARWVSGLPAFSTPAGGLSTESATRVEHLMNALLTRARTRIGEASNDIAASLSAATMSRNYAAASTKDFITATGFVQNAAGRTLNSAGSVSTSVSSQIIGWNSTAVSFVLEDADTLRDAVANKRLLSAVHAWTIRGASSEVQEAYMQIESLLKKGNVPSHWIVQLHKYFAPGAAVCSATIASLQLHERQVVQAYADALRLAGKSNFRDLFKTFPRSTADITSESLIRPCASYVAISPVLARLLLPKEGSTRSVIPASPYLRHAAASLIATDAMLRAKLS